MEKGKKVRNLLIGISIFVIFGLLIFAGFHREKRNEKLPLSLSSELYYDMVIGYQEEGKNILFGLQKLEKETEKRRELEEECYQELEAVLQTAHWRKTDQMPDPEGDYCFMTAASFEEVGLGISINFYHESGILQIKHTDLTERASESESKEKIFLFQTKKKEQVYSDFKKIIESRQRQIEEGIKVGTN